MSARGRRFVDKAILWTVAALLRLLAHTFCSDFLQKRPELVVSQNSFRKLLDGVYMLRDGVSLYDGDMIHCVMDLIASEMLGSVAEVYLKANGTSKCDQLEQQAGLVIKWYLLNPIGIAVCAILSLSVLYNFIIACFVLTLVSGYLYASSILFALLVHLMLYPIIFFPVLLLKFASINNTAKLLTMFIATSVLLIQFNKYVIGSMDFIQATYIFLLDVRDLTPNVGIFWYFFIEVFNHFRTFFLWVFQVNILTYVIPITLTLRSNLTLLIHQFLILISVFSSYPSMADSIIYLSLMPLFNDFKKYFRWGMVVSVAFVTTVVLAPIMWQMWIVTGSGNANFYFAVTLSYSIAQIFLLTDLLYGYLRKEISDDRGDVDPEKLAFFVLK